MHGRLLLWTAVLAFVPSLGGQAPMPRDPKLCGGMSFTESSAKPSLALEARQFAIAGSGICDEYSWYGWAEPAPLYLGKGALQYIEYIERAVEIWNDALDRPGKESAIRIVTGRNPSLFSLPSQFWFSAEAIGDGYARDGQNVIYFKPSSVVKTRGLTKARREGRQLVEADIYINDEDEAEYGPELAQTHVMFEVDEARDVRG